MTLIVAYWNSRSKKFDGEALRLEVAHQRDRADYYLRKARRAETELTRLRSLPTAVSPPYPPGEAAVMPENGEKTVRDWQPKHKGCSVAWMTLTEDEIEITVRWIRPAVRGLDRIKHITFGVRLDRLTGEQVLQVLDLRLEAHIDRIVHADSLKLLARGNCSQRADTDRFQAERKQQLKRGTVSGLVLPGIAAAPRPNRKARLAAKALGPKPPPNFQPRVRKVAAQPAAGSQCLRTARRW